MPPILLKGTPLVNVSKQKYLGITTDSNLTWPYHVANVSKKMAYYLYFIGYHQKVLPNNIIKISLVFSHCVYGFPCVQSSCLDPSLSVNLLLHNLLLIYTIVGSVCHLAYVNMTMCHTTDLLLVGSLLALLFHIAHLLLCMSSTDVIIACC